MPHVLTFIFALGASAIWFEAHALAQDDEEFGGRSQNNEVNSESRDGLDRATPSDNINDVNGSLDGPPEDGPAPKSSNDQPGLEGANDFNGKSAPSGNNSGNFNNVPAADGAMGNGAQNAPKNNTALPGGNEGPANAPFNTSSPLNNAPPSNLPPVDNVLPINVDAPAPLPVAQPVDKAADKPAPAPEPEPAKEAFRPKGPPELPGEERAINARPLPPPNEFAGAPPIPDTMRVMADGEAPEEYVVEPGDNLNDICDQLLDEAGYWPKLWALNPEIKNPHFIFPNMRLRFYPGDDETPPYLQVVTEDDVIPIDKGSLDEAQLVAEQVNFPKAAQIAAENLVQVIGPDQVDALQDEILSSGRIFSASEKPAHVPAFIYAKEKEALATIVGGREGQVNVPESGSVFVEAGATVSPGTLYTVLRSSGEVLSPEDDDPVGFRYYFIANLRIARLTEEHYYSGVVQDSQFGVMPGDLVVPYISTKRSVPLNDGLGPFASIKAHIVAWENFNQETGGRGGYAMIDKGSAAGVTLGSYLPIYATPGYMSLSSGVKDVPIDYQVIGAMRIIDVTDAGACGYVVRSTEEVRIGDRTRK